MYTGCTDPYCTYAHSKPVARWTPAYATKPGGNPVVLDKPQGSILGNGTPFPMMNPVKRFVVRFDSDSEDEDENPPARASVSSKDVMDQNEQWLARKHQIAHDVWFERLRAEFERKREELKKKLGK
jgi:hypothetical protein